MSLRPGQAKGPSLTTGGGGGGGGAISYGANVGTGSGEVFKNAVGDTLNFRTLLEGAGITITTGTNEVTIGLDQAGTTNRIVKWLNGTGTLADSLMLEQTDGVILSTDVGAPGDINFRFGDEGVEKVNLIKEATTQDFVVELASYGEAMRFVQTNGYVGLSTNAPVSRLHISQDAPCYFTIENTVVPSPGDIIGGIDFIGETGDGLTKLSYGYIDVEMTTPLTSTTSDGCLALGVRYHDATYKGLSVCGASAIDLAVNIFGKDGNKYAFFDAATRSLTIGIHSSPGGITNLVSKDDIPETQQTVSNIGPEDADGGTFVRNGHVYTRTDVGLLTDDASKLIVDVGHIGYGHAWLSTANGYDDHVHQVNFNFDSSGAMNMYCAVGSVANADTDGNLCVYVDGSGNLQMKNRLGGTRTFGYNVTYYDNPDLLLNVWTPIGYVKNWRHNAMSSNGTYQTAVAYNDYIYRSIDGGTTFSAVDSIRKWYGVAMDSTGQYQYAIAGGYLAADVGRAYYSTDYGATWTLVTDSPLNVNRNLHHVECDSTGQYVVICEHYNPGAGKIYYSSDYGVTWTLSNAPTKSWAAVCSSSDGQLMYAAVDGGHLYKSTDYGATWVDFYSGAGNVEWDGIDCSADGQYITAVIDGGKIYISSNGGTSFTDVASVQYWHDVAMEPTGQYQVAVIQFNNISAGGVYYSDDYGATWTKYDAPPDAIWWCVAMASSSIRTLIGKNTAIYVYS